MLKECRGERFVCQARKPLKIWWFSVNSYSFHQFESITQTWYRSCEKASLLTRRRHFLPIEDRAKGVAADD